MSHTTKAPVNELTVDQVRDQGTKARSARTSKPSQGTAKLGQGVAAAAETVFLRVQEARTS